MPSDDAKPAKKRSAVGEDDDETCLGAIFENRKKKSNESSGSKSSVKEAKVKNEPKQDFDSDKPVRARSKKAKVKKEEIDDKDDVDVKPILRRVSGAKPDKDLKKNKNSSGTEQKKVRKVYDLPGQTRDPPEKRDPSRVFYESLLEQVPNSEMAQIWMMESGLLPKEAAVKVLEKKQSKKKTLSSLTKAVKKTVSPAVKKRTVLSPASLDKKKSTVSKTAAKPTKKQKSMDESSDEDSDDDDFIINRKTTKKRLT